MGHRWVRPEHVERMHALLDDGLTRFDVAIEMDVDPTTVFRHTRGRKVKRARGPKVEELRKRVAWHDKHRRGEVSLGCAAEACGYGDRTRFSNAVSIARVVLKRIEAGEARAYPFSGKGPRKRDQKKALHPVAK